MSTEINECNLDKSTAPRIPALDLEIKPQNKLQLVKEEEIVVKLKKTVYLNKFLNGKECETLIVDKAKEIALSLLDEYGWKDHSFKDKMVDLMVSAAEWESDLVSTKLSMITIFLREKDKYDNQAVIQ